MFLKNCYDLASLKRKRSSHIYNEKAWTSDTILAWLFLAGMNILPRSVKINSFEYTLALAWMFITSQLIWVFNVMMWYVLQFLDMIGC